MPALALHPVPGCHWAAGHRAGSLGPVFFFLIMIFIISIILLLFFNNDFYLLLFYYFYFFLLLQGCVSFLLYSKVTQSHPHTHIYTLFFSHYPPPQVTRFSSQCYMAESHCLPITNAIVFSVQFFSQHSRQKKGREAGSIRSSLPKQDREG